MNKLNKAQMESFNKFEKKISELKKMMEDWYIWDQKWAQYFWDKKEEIFLMAERIISKSKIKEIIEKMNDVRIQGQVVYREQQYGAIIKIFEFIHSNILENNEQINHLDVFKNNNTKFSISKTLNNESDNVLNNNTQNQNIIKDTLNDNLSITLEDISKILWLSYTINDDNFDNIFVHIDEIKKQKLALINNKLKFINEKFLVDGEVKEKLNDIMEYIEERLKEIEENILVQKTEWQKWKLIEQEEKKLKKEKIKNVLDTQLSTFEDIVFQTNTEIQNMNWEKKDEIIDIKNKILDNISLIIKNITESFNWDPSYSVIINKISELKKIYDNMDLKRFQSSIEKWYLLWDIYESLLNIQDKYQIELNINNYQNLNIGIKKYKLDQL